MSEFKELLEAAGEQGKVRAADYEHWVIGIERRKKVDNKWVSVSTPYMSVDGRVRMAVDDHYRHDHARLDFAPPVVLAHDDTQVTLMVTVESEVYGRRSGIATSWLDGRGSPIEKAHPFEVAECVSVTTEMLTREGWKHYRYLREGEEVLAYDVQDDVLRWVPLLAVRSYDRQPMIEMRGKSFRAVCTPDHKWATFKQVTHGERVSTRPGLTPANELNSSHRIITAAAEHDDGGGLATLNQREASIIGWLFTDGHVRYHKGWPSRATITQSKRENLLWLSELLDGVAQRLAPIPAQDHTFPSGETYHCQEHQRWSLPTEYVQALLGKARVRTSEDLPRLAAQVTLPCAKAMWDAMMAADGTARRVFGKKKRGVLDAWQILCVRLGMALGKPGTSSAGDVPIQAARVTRETYCSELETRAMPPQACWCPQTPLGTWIARQDGYVWITGNTSAIGRALAAMGYGLIPGSGLASAEDMERATAEKRPAKPDPDSNDKYGHEHLSDRQVDYLVARYAGAYRASPKKAFAELQKSWPTLYGHPFAHCTEDEARLYLSSLGGQVEQEEQTEAQQKAVAAAQDQLRRRFFATLNELGMTKEAAYIALDVQSVSDLYDVDWDEIEAALRHWQGEEADGG